MGSSGKLAVCSQPSLQEFVRFDARCVGTCAPCIAGNWGKEGANGAIELPPTVPAGLEYFNPGAAA